MSRHAITWRTVSEDTYPRREPSEAKITDVSPLSTGFSSFRSGAVAAMASTYPASDIAPMAHVMASTPTASSNLLCPPRRLRLLDCRWR